MCWHRWRFPLFPVAANALFNCGVIRSSLTCLTDGLVADPDFGRDSAIGFLLVRGNGRGRPFSCRYVRCAANLPRAFQTTRRRARRHHAVVASNASVHTLIKVLRIKRRVHFRSACICRIRDIFLTRTSRKPGGDHDDGNRTDHSLASASHHWVRLALAGPKLPALETLSAWRRDSETS